MFTVLVEVAVKHAVLLISGTTGKGWFCSPKDVEFTDEHLCSWFDEGLEL